MDSSSVVVTLPSIPTTANKETGNPPGTGLPASEALITFMPGEQTIGTSSRQSG
jgi:hypothetical protein